MFKRLILGLSIVAGLWTLTPTPEAEARGWRSRGSGRHHVRPPRRVRPHRKARAVPELDSGVAGSAMVLLIGGVAYLASRRREEENHA